MPPKKRVRDDASPEGGDVAVDAQTIIQPEYLKSAAAGQVLARLLEMKNALERGTPGGAMSSLISKHFIEEVTKNEYIHHPSADVQCIVAVILAECLRIKSDLEFGKRSNEVLNLIGSVLGGKSTAAVTSKKVVAGVTTPPPAFSTQDALQRRHLIEALSSGHGLVSLVKQAKGNVVEDLVASITERLLFSGEAVDDSQVANCATVISDTIAAHHSISTIQFHFLLAAAGAPPKGMTPCHSNVSKHISAAVFRRSEDVFHELISEYVVNGLTDTVDELRKIEIADGEPSEKKAAVVEMNRIAEVIPAVATISSNLGFRLFPEAGRFLCEETYEVRSAMVKVFTTAFTVNPKLRSDYSPLYHTLLGRVTDARPTIRSYMIKHLTALVSTFNPSSTTGANQQDAGSWVELANLIAGRLVDGDEAIRRQAVEATCDMAAAAPVKFLQLFPKGGDLAARCADKKLSVRRVAIDQLSSLFLKFRAVGTLKVLMTAKVDITWIPNAIMASCASLEGAVQYVEHGLEKMMSIRGGGKSSSSSNFAADDASPAPKKVGTRKAASAAGSRTASKPVSRSATAAVFDFEEESIVAAAVGGVLGESTYEEINTNVPCALSFFCRQLEKDNLHALILLAEKKKMLRDVVLKLLTLREAIKTSGAENVDESIIINVKRLIAFLGKLTHGDDFWNTLFKLKDAKPIKALQALCAEDCGDYVKATQDCLTTFKGRVEEKTYRFLEENLIHRLSFPVSQRDTDDLINLIEQRRENAAAAGATLGYLRALRAISATAHHFISPHAVTLVKWIGLDAGSAASSSSSDSKEGGAAVRSHQHFISAFNEELNVLSLVNPEHSKISDSQKKTVINTIGRICMSSEDGSAAKTAAKCLCKLFKKDTKVFVALLKNISQSLAVAAEDTSANLSAKVVSHMRTVQVFIQEAPQAAKMEIQQSNLLPGIMDSVEAILHLTVGSSTNADDIPAKSKAVKLAGGLLRYVSPLSEAVAVAAKVITTHAKHCPAQSRSSTIAAAMQTLIEAFRKTQEITAGEEAVGSTLRRMALDKQLVQLFVMEGGLSATDVSLNVAAMVFITSETSQEARAEVQRKLLGHITKKGAGCAILSLLCLSGFSEEHRGGYNALKVLIGKAAEHMRSKIGDTTLTDPAAPGVYIEFTLPYLISWMSHHTFYNAEADEFNFSNFQKVFILFFEELFRHDTKAASFVQEMLRRLKAHNDVLDEKCTHTREMADLAAKVMWDLLAQKSVTLDQVKNFPGAVLIPQSLYRQDRRGDFPTEKVYLDKRVTLIHQPQFKLLTAQTPAGKSLNRPSLSPAAPDRHEEEESPPKKKARKEEPSSPPDTGLSRHSGGHAAASYNTPARGRGGTQSPVKGRGGSGAKKGTHAEASDDEEDENSTQEVVEATIAELTEGLTATQIGKLSWKVVQVTLREALGLPKTAALSEEVRDLARTAVASAVNAAADSSQA